MEMEELEDAEKVIAPAKSSTTPKRKVRSITVPEQTQTDASAATTPCDTSVENVQPIPEFPALPVSFPQLVVHGSTSETFYSPSGSFGMSGGFHSPRGAFGMTSGFESISALLPDPVARNASEHYTAPWGGVLELSAEPWMGELATAQDQLIFASMCSPRGALASSLQDGPFQSSLLACLN